MFSHNVEFYHRQSTIKKDKKLVNKI